MHQFINLIFILLFEIYEKFVTWFSEHSVLYLDFSINHNCGVHDSDSCCEVCGIELLQATSMCVSLLCVKKWDNHCI